MLCSTLTTAACDCGSPDKNLQFTAEGHFIGLESLSCDEWYGQIGAPGVVTSMTAGTNPASTPDTMEGLFAGMAWLFKGDIHLMSNMDGIQEAKGVVEFIPAVGDVPALNFTRSGSFGRRLQEAAPIDATLAATKKGEAVTAPVKEAQKPVEQPKAAPVNPAPAKEALKAAQQPKATSAQPAPAKDVPKAAPVNPTPVKETPKAAPAPAKEAPKPAEHPKAAPNPSKETPKPAPAHPAPAKDAPEPVDQPKVTPAKPAPTKEAPKAAPVHPAPAKAAPAKPQQPAQRAPAAQQSPQLKQVSSVLPGIAKRQVGSGDSHKHRVAALEKLGYEHGVPVSMPLVKGGSLKVVLFEKDHKEY